MEKRLIFAVVLSVLVLSLYSHFAGKYAPKQSVGLLETNKLVKVSEPTLPSQTASQPASQKAELKTENAVPLKIVNLNTEETNFGLSDPGGMLVEIYLNKFTDDKTKQPTILFATQDAGFGLSAINKGEDFFNRAQRQNISPKTNEAASLIYSENGLIFKKAFSHHKGSYFNELELSLDNKQSQDWTGSYEINALGYQVKNADMDSRFDQLIIQGTDKPIKMSPQKIKNETLVYAGEVKWVALKYRYYSIIVKPDFAIKTVKGYREGNFIRIALEDEFDIKPGSSLNRKFITFVGPNSLKELSLENHGFDSILDSGVIDTTLLFILRFFERFTKNWGISIILISILIFVVFLPFTSLSMKSMRQMQALAPKIEELRKEYKDNPQKMNKEVMEIYKKNKVNPFGGCLPMLLQIPIFFALYQVLMKSVELKGSQFLWIKDLSLPDRAMMLSKSFPVVGNEINALPLLMGIGMFFQQKFSSTTMSAQQAEQQRMMMIIMPIMFCFLFYKFPAGLALYWLTNTILMLVYYYRIRHVSH